MTNKNIGSTSILLLILVLIVGIIFYLAKAKALGGEGLGVRTASVTSASSWGRLGVLAKQVLVAELKGMDALNDRVWNVDAELLSCASRNLLNT